MSSKTASGAQGERRVTVPLHDNLGPLHYKLTDDAVAGPSPGDLFYQRTSRLVLPFLRSYRHSYQ
jgi:hypothetical protein